MKKYIAPATKLIFLDPVESMMTLTGSGTDGLDGTRYGGNTSAQNNLDADSNRRTSIWGDEN